MAPRFHWRRLLIATHRDIGYLLAGLTIAYAVSGLAVNHVQDWNPTYSIRQETRATGPLPAGDLRAAADVALGRLGISEAPQSIVPAGPGRVRVFLKNRTLTVDVARQEASDERVSARPVLSQANYLHLNRGKGAWTWIADLYAVGLLFMAVSGILIVKGRLGLAGRGLWLLLAGLVPPIAFLLWGG